MSEMCLFNILGDLRDDEFENFKWFLKREKVGDIPPIQVGKLSKAARRDTVDLMVEKYEAAAAVEVTTSILKKMSRNDLVAKLANVASGAEDPALHQEHPPRPPIGSPQSMLSSARTQFVASVSDEILNQLLDRLLQRGVINQEEMDSATGRSRADKARAVIDMVRRKGARASSSLIEDLKQLDPHLSETLQWS